MADPVDVEWGGSWPGRAEFRELARTRRLIPVVRRVLADEVSALGLYRTLAGGRPGTFILESAEHDGTWGRWSFIGARTAGMIQGRAGRAHWVGERPSGALAEGPLLDVLRSALHTLRAPRVPGLPPLTGGLVGALGWDIVGSWEPTLRASKPREVDVPDVTLLLASDVVAVDHRDGSVWLIANAYNMNGTDQGVDAAYDRALARLESLARRVRQPFAPVVLGSAGRDAGRPLVRHRTPQAQFEASVRSAKRAIRDGEVFQVVVSQRMDVDTTADPFDVYRVLRSINPSPYMYYLSLPDEHGEPYQVVGSSPETLVKVEGRTIWSYPLAGSRPRGAGPAQDRALVRELLADPKEISEHVMLVDLARNDLSKVCEPGSVAVPSLMEVKQFSHIQHISSTVTGRVRADADAVDVLAATFPAGTLSGAPKPRAIRLIDELEPAARPVYGGVVGYFDLSGDLDLAIAIRTACVTGATAHVQAGAGLVADSVPQREYTETRNKAAAVVEAVRVAQGLGPLSAPDPHDGPREGAGAGGSSIGRIEGGAK